MASITDSILEFVARAFLPLARDMGTTDERLVDYVAELGWQLPAIPTGLRALQSTTDQLAQSLGAVDELRRRQLDGLASAGDAAAAGGELALDTLLFVDAVRSLAASIRAELPPAYVAATGIDEEFHRRLIEHALVQRLEREYLRPFLVLRGLGLVESAREAADPERFQPRFTSRRARWDRAIRLMRDPRAHAREVFGWGTEQLDTDAVTMAVRDLSFALLRPGRFSPAPRSLERHLVDVGPTDPGMPGFIVPLFQLAPIEVGVGLFAAPKGTADELQGLLLTAVASGALSGSFALSSRVKVEALIELDATSGIGVVIKPDRMPEVLTGHLGDAVVPALDGRATLSLLWRIAESADDGPAGSVGPVLLSGAGLEIRTGLVAGSNSDVFIEAGVHGGRIAISQPQDAFLARVLPSDGAACDFDIGMGWSARRGFYLRGSGTLDVSRPVHRSLGPVTIDMIHARLAAAEPRLEAQAAVSLRAALGPIGISVSRLGMAMAVDVERDELGGGGIDAAFVPPAGYGLTIDAGPVRGGGFLTREQDRYRGALELQVFDVGLRALGLLDTQLPGGVPAYSLVAMIAAELPPVPLGFGFTLKEVGGLLGVHRSADVEQLRRLLREGRLDDLFFAESPVADGPRIAADLASAFPPAADRYVFGPMAKIGWGPGSMVEAKIGLVLELPDPVRLILLGTIDAAFPRRQAALIDLHLDVLGELDVGRKRLAIDGRLRDSKVASFSIEGEMAMRVGWGQEPSFALSIGGFHPDFRPPAGFPTLQKVTVPVGLDDNPRVTLQGYLALTSNTFQIGASADVYASAGWFNITGGVDFDALFQFSPFAFVADFSGRVTLRKGTTDLAGVSLDARISGPSPWHASGEACLVLKWLPDPCVGFDATFGNERREDVPRVDPWPILRAAIENRQSWSSARPAGSYSGAILAGDGLDPGAGLTFRQSAVPLNRLLRRFGEAEPLGGTVSFTVDAVAPGGEGGGWTSVTDGFAPAQFEPLSDEEKLSRRSFEPMDAGVTVAQDAVARGAALERTVEYETRTIDSAFPGAPPRPHRPDLLAVEAALMAGATADSPLRSVGPRRYQTPEARPLVTLDDELYVISSTLDLAPRTDISAPGQQGAVLAALAAHLAAHPEDQAALQVVPVDELAVPP